ncbi:hypothetical protein SKAU_G00296600 [Synaphobranchus kaupii]|uniref:Uncharacterized protein n=1 Tax=Synaphobranchus kaupii TaxID=118154 RepID=A0A9Q1EUT5_SYNKA|nr:hypothetical protein SKAU_G00296600 [Synaphobranchus kaupii]
MADKEGNRVAQFAVMNSVEPKKPLSAAQKEFVRRMELERLRKHSHISVVLVPPFIRVSQERIMDELDEEARFAMSRGPRTGAN